MKKETALVVVGLTIMVATMVWLGGDRTELGSRGGHAQATSSKIDHDPTPPETPESDPRPPAAAGSDMPVGTAYASAVSAVQEGAGEDAVSQSWDQRTSDERREHLLDAFRTATDAMGADGEDWSQAHGEATSALSALRGELYATERGRKQHRQLEQRLDQLVEAKESR